MSVTTIASQVCIVCQREKPVEDFPEDGKVSSYSDRRRCAACIFDGKVAEPRPPRLHYCPSCGWRVLAPGECGFCIEEQTRVPLTTPQPVPEQAGNTAEGNRRRWSTIEAQLTTSRRSVIAVSRALAARCIRGHLFDEENTRITQTGGRQCRRCEGERKRRKRQEAREAALA